MLRLREMAVQRRLESVVRNVSLAVPFGLARYVKSRSERKFGSHAKDS